MSRGSLIARRRRSVLGVLCAAAVCIAASVGGCSIEEGALRDDADDLVSHGSTGGSASKNPEGVTPEPCARNQHVEDHACVPCPDGLQSSAGDDPTGKDTECSESPDPQEEPEEPDSQAEPEEPEGPRELGAPCGGNDACASEHCVDGVCCESACDGPCKACSEAGVCNVTPADDDACGVILCQAGAEECLLYDPAITTDRCRGFGECKTPDDCVPEHQTRGTPCAVQESRDSVCVEGVCALPSVLCGANTCAGGFGDQTPRICCNREDGQSCSVCPSTGLKAPEPATPIYCDEHEDCRHGTRCSLLMALDDSRIWCTADPQYASMSEDRYEVCDSPAMDPVPCSNGAACKVTSWLFEGWTFCSHK